MPAEYITIDYKEFGSELRKIEFKSASKLKNPSKYRTFLRGKIPYIKGGIVLSKLELVESKSKGKYHKLEFKFDEDFAGFMKKLQTRILKKFQKHVLKSGFKIENILSEGGIYKTHLKNHSDGDTNIYCFHNGEDDVIEDLAADNFGEFFKPNDKFIGSFELTGVKLKDSNLIVVFKLHSIESEDKKEPEKKLEPEKEESEEESDFSDYASDSSDDF